uniref:Uncharacterized protein n=1 Tax=Chenopodium quinoa TaxID=63459 RepID=A0A803MM09_CHEQI
MWSSVGKYAGASQEEEDDQEFTYAGVVSCYYANTASTTKIIGSKASDHITSNFEKLENAKKCKSEAKINLSTGHSSRITHKGSWSDQRNSKAGNGLYYLINESMISVIKKLAVMKKRSEKVALNATSTTAIPRTVRNVSKLSTPTHWHQ